MAYQSPGVFVEEVPSAIQPIAGVSTSTPAFIGVMPESVPIPNYPAIRILGEEITIAAGTKQGDLAHYPVIRIPGAFTVKRKGVPVDGTTLEYDSTQKKARVIVTDAPTANDKVTVDYFYIQPVTDEQVGFTGAAGSNKSFRLKNYPVMADSSLFTVKIKGESMLPSKQVISAKLTNDPDAKTTQVTITNSDSLPFNQAVTVTYYPDWPQTKVKAVIGKVKLYTAFDDFRVDYGDFSADRGQNTLAHAIYGFFHNGGSRCYVLCVASKDAISAATLAALEPYEEIAMIAAPGITDPAAIDALDTYCRQTMRNCVAIVDGPPDVDPNSLNQVVAGAAPAGITYTLPGHSDYLALYYPWLQVFDPATKAWNPAGDGSRLVPPSGHMAGVYARVDNSRGVHKAPANEVVLGALALPYQISKAQQDGLNPQGVNCIRTLNGNIRVWGARTLGGDANGEWKYISVRRLCIYLEQSIKAGTQWTVFEPNTPLLWAKITRNVTAFLTNVWQAGALFGASAQEAFYVRCDAALNPSSTRDLGQVVTEIGVAVVEPAEFVIFRISQWSAPAKG